MTSVPTHPPEAMPDRDSSPSCPPVPENLAGTGLLAETITDLLLKTIYVQGARTGQQLTDAIRLPFLCLDDGLVELQQRRFIEVRGTTGHSRAGYIFDLSTEGRGRAREAFAAGQYVGPAPVPLEQYRHWTTRQSIAHTRITRETVREGFRALVLDEPTLEMLGPAINSAKSLFLYGAPGNGKTCISEAIASLLGGGLYIPYAIEVEGQTVVLFDPMHHRDLPEPEAEPVDGQPIWLKAAERYDRRYVRVARPIVTVGGELTMDQLDLQYDAHTKIHQAPFQLKANGGVLIVDDFGRQQIPPDDLLNRWIVPLDKRIDFLTLYTGGKFPVPFDSLLIFATNLAPSALMEEAFVRRIHYKIHVLGPTRPEFAEIFRRCCAERGIPHVASAVDYIYRQYYERLGLAPRKCHPRDVLEHLIDVARFLEVEPRLTNELLDRACQSYFLDEIPS